MAIPTTKERLIVALDVPTPAEARAMVEKLGDTVLFYKLGLELFMADGFWDLMAWLVEKKDKKVFADLKFHDIPRTVGAAVENLAKRGASFTTIHSGQRAMVEAAAKAKGDMELLAVTILTSMTEADCRDVGYKGTVAELVEKRAKHATALGCDGIIASALESASLRKALGKDRLIVTPGIRASGKAEGDQKRVADATTAIRSGASHLVVGRPILQAEDPVAAAEAFQQEIATASSAKAAK